MSTPYESARLLLKLYDLRREPLLREARTWITRSFNPASAKEILDLSPDENRMYRMATTYWDMACALVNHGAVDRQMFVDVSGEALVVFAKLQPYVVELREAQGNPNVLKQTEQLVMSLPGVDARLEALRKRFLVIAAKEGKAGAKRKARPAKKGTRRR